MSVMKAYECTRCDSFGNSGDPESQRCECDDIEENLRADITALTTDRDSLAAQLAEAKGHLDRRDAIGAVRDKMLAVATEIATSNAAQLAAVTAQLAEAVRERDVAMAELPGEAATIDAVVAYLRDRHPAAAWEIDSGAWRKETP